MNRGERFQVRPERPTRAKALRAQASALRAQAEALDMEADVLDVETNTASVTGPEWTPVGSCGFPDKTVRRAIKRGELRGARIGRDLCVHRGDLAGWASQKQVSAAKPITPAAPVSMAPYERALRKVS